MDKITISNLLTNSGLTNIRMDDNFVYFDDPSCIFPAFDAILNYAWIAIVVLTAFMLFGWAVLYIKNGVKIDSLFHNARSMILIFCVLIVLKLIINVVYGDKLFANQCETHKVSLASVQELLDMRNKNFAQSDQAMLYETFEVIDTGVVYSDTENEAENSASSSNSGDENLMQTESLATSHDENFASIDTENDENLMQTESLATSHDEDFASIDTENDENYIPVSTAQSGFTRAKASSKDVIYTKPNGEKVKRSGGTRAWRNNNPGNMINSDFARKHGAIGTAGGFAVFPDEATGMKAVKTLLRSSSYINLSIREAIHKWAPAADNNDPKKYTNMVQKYTGLAPDKKIKSLNDNELEKVANAIRKVEGWNTGKEQKI